MVSLVAIPGMLVLIAMVLIPTVMYINNMDDGTVKLSTVKLDKRTFFTTVPYPLQEDVPDEAEVVWAVFFHKPYCSACRRIKPAFEGIARTTNATDRLRFGMLDCTKAKSVCQYEGVTKQPAVVLYKGYYEGDYYRREKVATWRGMLIAYELLIWFQNAQEAGHISEEVEWPDLDDLAQSILNYKTVSASKTSIPSSIDTEMTPAMRGGYLPAAEASLRMSLSDHVFPDGKLKKLRGPRLKAMMEYLEALKYTFPVSQRRKDIEKLKDTLDEHIKKTQTVTQDQFEAAVVAANLSQPVEDSDYDGSWCEIAEEGGGGGVGGYPCGLWALFHAMLANSDRFSAPHTLARIAGWVKNFFGCDYCAKHFMDMYNQLDGAKQKGHVDATLWLWEAHNRVRSRLSDDDTVLREKPQWPSRSVCDACFSEEVREGMAHFDPSGVGGFDPSAWSRSYIFDFMQELYCYGSDTFSCSQFHDPMYGKEPETLSLAIKVSIALVVIAFGAIALYYMKRAMESDLQKEREMRRELAEQQHDEEEETHRRFTARRARLLVQNNDDDSDGSSDDDDDEDEKTPSGLRKRVTAADEDGEQLD